jgi:DNA-directed RNA polymerase subunit omega
MILPLDKLIKWDGNVYEMTCAAIKRANQLTITGDQEVEENYGKVVPTAIKQILDKKVEYRIEE